MLRATLRLRTKPCKVYDGVVRRALATSFGHGMRVKDLILVRHGESEGNVARRLSLQGDHRLYEGEFLNRHSSLWRLTDRGRAQARSAGKWLQEEFQEIPGFSRHYTSEYLRAMETAALLELPNNPEWFAEVFLRERDWGQLDLMSQEERIANFSQELRRRDRDRFFWLPPGGESLAMVAMRVDRFLAMLNRECSNENVIVVCHGEVMWSFRLRLERMSQAQFHALGRSKDPHDRIHNGQILHYTRRNPNDGNDVRSAFHWYRSVCPWDKTLASPKWTRFHRTVYTSEMLLQESRRVKRLIPNSPTGILGSAATWAHEDSIESDKLAFVLADENDGSASKDNSHSTVVDDVGNEWHLPIKNLNNLSNGGSGPVKGSFDPPVGHSAGDAVGVLFDGDGNRIRRAKVLDEFADDRHTEASLTSSINRRGIDDVDLFAVPQDADGATEAGEGKSVIDMNNVGVLLKVSRLEAETGWMGNSATDKEVDEELKRRGFNPKRLRERHDAHHRAVDNMLNVMESRGLKYSMRHANRAEIDEFGEHELSAFDVVVAAGGDGTFLKLASQVTSRKLPVIGINTDPGGSKGALCCYSMNSHDRKFDYLLNMVESHGFHWRRHKRIKVVLESPDGTQKRNIRRFALNEIFFAERDASRPVGHGIFLDGEDELEFEKQLSSGVLVCTGTGSTAWMANATRVNPEIVLRVLDETGMHKATATNVAKTAEDIADRLNDAHTFDGDSSYMQYLMREPVVNDIYLAPERRHGWCNKMSILSLGWDSTLTLDGLYHYGVKHGWKARFSLDRDAVLTSIRLKQEIIV